jgi:endonuclease-3
VPADKTALLAIPGVGPKTAHLVLAEAFGIPELCVDTHVHRISNRLGLVKTKKPEETEKEIKALLPEKYWRLYTRYCIMWGQNICRPLSPRCSICPINKAQLCKRAGVTKSR